MCGIVGIMAPGLISDRNLQLFANLLFVDKIRGEHATGVAKINPWKGSVDILKKAVSSQVYLGQEDVHDFLGNNRGRIYIGHNRYATQGDKTADDNAHPFQEGHITMVHNGGVDRWAQNKLEGYTDPDVVVDSHMVCKTIAAHGIDEAVKKLSGAFALVWWDSNEKTLNFLRNSDRPLFLAELGDGSLVWASEKEFIEFFVNHKRSTLTIKGEIKSLPENMLVSWRFSDHGVLMSNGGKPFTRTLSFSKMEDPNPPKQQSSTWFGHVGSSSRYLSGNSLLEYWKCEKRIGDFLTVKVDALEIQNSMSNPDRVNVTATWDGFDVISYFIPGEKVRGAKYITGKIINAVSRKNTYQGHTWDECEIVLEAASVTRAFTPEPQKAATVTAPAGVVTGNVIKDRIAAVVTSSSYTYPLKVQGHTFQNSSEFRDYVSCGCAMCGNIPTAYDINNKDMTIYQVTGEQTDSLKDTEFVCGFCVKETEPAKK